MDYTAGSEGQVTMRPNQNVGAGRQSHTTANGLYLERRYTYLTPALWVSLHSLSKTAGISASLYLANLIAAEHGKSTQGNNTDDPTSRPSL